LRMVGNPAEAEDLTQEAFLQAYRRIQIDFHSSRHPRLQARRNWRHSWMLGREFQVAIAQSANAATRTSEAWSARQPFCGRRIRRKLSGDDSAGLLARLRQSLKAAYSQRAEMLPPILEKVKSCERSRTVSELSGEKRGRFFEKEFQLIMMDPVPGIGYRDQAAIADGLQSRVFMRCREKARQSPEQQSRGRNLTE
jgi:Sigma-70 region 2